MSTDCNPHPTEARALSNERIQRQPWYYYIFFSRGPASFLQLITNFSSLAACSFLSRPLPGACFTLLEVSRSFGRLPQVTFVSLKHLAREGTLPSLPSRSVWLRASAFRGRGEKRKETRYLRLRRSNRFDDSSWANFSETPPHTNQFCRIFGRGVFGRDIKRFNSSRFERGYEKRFRFLCFYTFDGWRMNSVKSK